MLHGLYSDVYSVLSFVQSFEGSIIRVIRRLEELTRQLADASKVSAHTLSVLCLPVGLYSLSLFHTVCLALPLLPCIFFQSLLYVFTSSIRII